MTFVGSPCDWLATGVSLAVLLVAVWEPWIIAALGRLGDNDGD